CARDGAWFAYW
nr:immunoglobulin heavy chain junction region [Mus musculus]